MLKNADTNNFLLFFVLQAQSFKHVLWGIQAHLALHWRLLIWRQDDRWLICECHVISVSSGNLLSVPLFTVVLPVQKAMEQEEGDEEEEKETKPDPLHQLILHFSRTALTEKRLDRSSMTVYSDTEMQKYAVKTQWRYSKFTNSSLLSQFQQTWYRSSLHGICRYYGKGELLQRVLAMSWALICAYLYFEMLICWYICLIFQFI